MQATSGHDSHREEEKASSNSNTSSAVKSSRDSPALSNENKSLVAAPTELLDRSTPLTRRVTACNRDLLIEPSAKRLRCTPLMNESLIVPPPCQNRTPDESGYSHRCSASNVFTLDPLTCGITDEKLRVKLSQFKSTAKDREEEDPECVTPTAKEQRIPESKDLVCPPPPRKRKATAYMRLSSLSSTYFPSNLVVSPSDLHAFPDCIRALFQK